MNDGAMGGYFIGAIIAGAVAIWVATDANKRGMNGIGWGIGVFLLCIVFLPIYLIVRKPLLVQPQFPGAVPGGFVPPPAPPQMNPPMQPPPMQPPPIQPPPATGAQPAHSFCANCGAKMTPGTKFCPNCGHAA